MIQKSPCCNAPIVYKYNCSICGEPVTDVEQMLKEILDRDFEKRTSKTSKRNNHNDTTLLQNKTF